MNKTTILLVDDDTDFVDVYKKLLVRHKFNVEVAYNGAQCFQKLSSGLKPDLIILDVIMTTPTEGFDVARKLKEDSETKQIPIIMLTSIGEAFAIKYREDEAWLPVDQFLEKPIEPKILIDEIRRNIKP